MLPFTDTMLKLNRLADPNCPHCYGAGWRLNLEKTPIACECTRRNNGFMAKFKPEGTVRAVTVSELPTGASATWEGKELPWVADDTSKGDA